MKMMLVTVAMMGMFFVWFDHEFYVTKNEPNHRLYK